MSIPPCFADFGKKASKLFTDDYVFGRVKATMKTTASNGVEVKTSGESNTDTRKASGSLEVKYVHKLKQCDLTVKEKLDTDNVLNAEITADDLGLDGLQLGFDTMFIPTTGQKSGKFKLTFKRPHVHFKTDAEVDYIGPVLRSSLAVSHGPWMAGFQGVYEGSQGRLTANSLGLAYEAKEGDYTLSATLQNGSEFMGALHQRLSRSLEFGVQASCSLTSTATNMAVGARYQLTNDSFIKAKVNNRSHLGLAYGVSLQSGVKLVGSAIVDASTATQTNHRVGLSLEFN